MTCRPKLSLTLMILALGIVAVSATAAENLWSDVSPNSIAPTGDRPIAPQQYRALSVDLDGLAVLLTGAPLEGTPEAAHRAVIELPLPYGGFGRFSIVESPILAPELQAKFPEIRTYAGYGLDDQTATTRLDLTPHGFHAAVFSANGSFYIDPFQQGDIQHYQSFYKRDHVSDQRLESCTVLDEDHMGEEIQRLVAGGAGQRSGTQRRTYRAAVAATGEYTAFHGGTVALGLAAVTTSMNRVTGVYERDVSIRMVLIPNNNLIIYTNASTDPYTNSSGSTMLGQNQANLDAVIGNANYDIGHVFSTGGGGIAGLGVVCRTGNKARGVTGLPAPIGDNFDIDYVAHEMGHQYGSNHNFNGTAGSCSGGNRNASTAYEPGSGSTIMAYAGICAPQNLQAHSDDLFQWISIQEIVSYSTVGAGNACPVITPTGAIEPVVEAGPGGFSIPKGTPFELTASAVTTGTPSWIWEEADLGPAGAPNTPTGNAPIFRGFEAVDTPWRVFPKLSNLLNNTQTIGEILPSYARNLTFRCTVRDLQAGFVAVGMDATLFYVADSGPFLVTAPNTTGIEWAATSTEAVTWNVAGTDLVPISCANVDILLSTDGGNTWPITVLAATPNDGSEDIIVPNYPTTTARIKVKASNSIWFDISNTNFTIIDATDVAEAASSPSGLTLHANRPNPFTPATTISYDLPRTGQIALGVFDPAGRLVRTLVEGQVGAGRHQALWDGTDASGRQVGSGVYLYRLNAMGETLTGRMTLIR